MNTINWALLTYSGLSGAVVGAVSTLTAVAQRRRRAIREHESPGYYRGLVQDV